MGLFVNEDGHLQGWLAALLCCWAAVGEDEHDREKNRTKAHISRPVVYHQQPTPLGPMPRYPSRSPAAFQDAAFTDEDRVRPISERPPSIKPLDFGDATLMGRFSLHGGRRRSSTILLSPRSPKRSSIGNPSNFRRLEYTEKQRRSLKPLQLEPVVLRGGEPDSTPSEPDLETSRESFRRRSYRDSRDTPFERCQHKSATARREPSPPGAQDERSHIREPAKAQQPAPPALSTQSSASSIRSLRRPALESSASGTTTSSRPSSERSRLQRKRSNLSSRFPSAGSNDLDKEILELNTIVEERRAETARSYSPDDKHVPAVAPLMTVRARSETLTDIGSAFSRPLRLETDCRNPKDAVSPVKSPAKSPAKSRLSRPFTNMPESTLTVEDVGVVRRPSSRVTGWLTNLLAPSSYTTPPTSTPASTSFYTCAPQGRRRAVSEASLCTTVTEMASPSLTTTSSPHSHGHSRSFTGESRLTPISPPSTVCTVDLETRDARQKASEPWPHVTEHPSQVGLAL